MTRRGAAFLAVAVAASIATPARAEDLIGYLELNGFESDTRQELPGIAVVTTRNETWNRRVHVSFARRLFPRLQVWGGGTFDDSDSMILQDGVRNDLDVRRLRPYFGLRRQAPYQYQQILWSRNEERVTTELTGLTTIHDGVSGVLGWNHPGLPLVRLSASHTTDYDRERRIRDLVSDFVDLTATHQFGESLWTTYRGTLTIDDDRLVDTEGRFTSHAATLRYDDAWFDRRATLLSEYSITSRSTSITSASGEAIVSLFPEGGISTCPPAGPCDRDDTPLDGALLPDPPLIDDDVTTAGTIDLGLPAPGGDRRPFGLGLDFGIEVTVNLLFVTLDRELPPETARTLGFELYTSANNLVWTPRGSVADVRYDEFRRRFELRFSDQTARFVKLVVEPLAPDAPFASEHPDVFVTELDAAVRSDLPDRRLDEDELIQTAQVNVRVRLLDDHELYYEGSFYGTDSSLRGERWNAANGLYFMEPLNEVYAVSGRIQWEEKKTASGRDHGLFYSTSLSVVPVPLLRYTLVVSGRDEGNVVDAESGDVVNVFLQALATLYEGVDVQLGVGRSRQDVLSGGETTSTQVTASARLVPSPEWTFGLSYLDTTSERFAPVVVADSRTFSRAAEVNGAFTPVPTMYMYGSYRLEWRPDEDRDAIRNFTFSFAPFPGGSLRLGLNYDERKRETGDQRERVFGPSVRWDLNRRSFVQVAYQDVREVTALQNFDNRVLFATLRWGF